MKKHKIGIVTPAFPPSGGGVATTHYNIYQLLKEDYDLRVFAYNDDAKGDEADVIRRKTPKSLSSLLNLIVSLYFRKKKIRTESQYVKWIILTSVGAKRLNREIKKYSPDVLIVPDNNLPLYWLKKPVKTKIVWFAHHNYSRFRKNPLIGNSNWLDLDIAVSMEKKAFKKADLVISPSEYMAGVIKATLGENTPSVVIPNFVILPGGHDNSVNSKSKEVKPGVFIPSGGTYAKGERYSFEIIRGISAAANEKIRFIISGYISKELRFELAALKEEIEVITPGHISWEENLSLLKTCSIVVSPTLIENYSNAFVEALKLGKPVISFDVGGNREIIQDGYNGYIVDYLDVDKLIEKAAYVLNDPGILAVFSGNSLLRSQEVSDQALILAKYQEMITDLLSY